MRVGDAPALTILIADDNMTDRMLLSGIVRRQGHHVLQAGNGEEAVRIFEQVRPQLVLLDAMMPVMDGFEAARQIKARAGDELVPIIFLTSLTEEQALVQCVEAGGDDFLAKPYNQVVLGAKIKAMERMRRLQATVLEQRDLLAHHHNHLLNEQRVAKAVFDQVAHSGCLNTENIRYLQSPYALFNGDLLLAAYTPRGDMHVMLGDFTGHGLPAAVGAMPLAEAFYGMAAKGYGLAETLREMNAKLKRILPVDMFCCATLLNISPRRQVLEVWSGGMPDGYLQPADGPRTPVVSRHLPLGILESKSFDSAFETMPFRPGDRVFLMSDGVIDTANEHDELFGLDRLHRVFDHNKDPERLFEDIREALAEFRGESRDDVSMVQIRGWAPGEASEAVLAPVDSGQLTPRDWSVGFEFRAQTLRRYNPLPFLLQLLLEVQGLRDQSGALYTVLTELYSNALEHGVLGLASSLKADAKGFAEYYAQRQARLEALEEGYVRVDLDIHPLAGGGGELAISVRDSGPGFDVKAPLGKQSYSGRGMKLIRELAHQAQWSDDGRCARVEFIWRTEA
ncbi:MULTISPECIES: fused response regulator/phosphatase [unclassified Pseudomonas]|uniref:ATP-binding SpoIIE family protein phosphatase n=1 Tax=unclassified Pseudomonas TaxID=196821 RepID=UPI000BCA8616|nr:MULTISPECIES: fused response regulator/phosphatase [unclassified Pseudomonas]PVZ13706.1 histidine kinase-like protein [Pseudomonas sp. URIL14HWK12:I12]PVZ24012.1 histidine kinase-like protein [Pseudomonas sp. URIL14HWK12:I10]PVZ33349.1 histidine kinase-like protein [Pseudomonas sp. URIL14HWK12:I11]SNZ11244.1 Response regulator containing a CheY-like receiver domain and a GGDEF domain [Pseudomonas sp. URIL14HWK12:I9]